MLKIYNMLQETEIYHSLVIEDEHLPVLFAWVTHSRLSVGLRV